jgi:tetratricopeptide (TPR) repeat protein
MTDSIDQLLTHAAQARRENRPADARIALVEAVAQARGAHDAQILARALKALGRIERDLNHRDAALQHYEEAAALERANAADPLSLAQTIRHLGDVHQNSGRLAQAEPLYLEALAIYRAHPEAPALDLANAVRPLALLKEATGHDDEAAELWNEARNIYATQEIFPGVAECAAHQALIANRRKDAARAQQLLAEATEAAQKSGDENSIRNLNEIRAKITG